MILVVFSSLIDCVILRPSRWTGPHAMHHGIPDRRQQQPAPGAVLQSTRPLARRDLLSKHLHRAEPTSLMEVRASVTLQQHPVGVFGSRNTGLLSPAHRQGRWMLQEGTFGREAWRPPEWTRFLLLTLYVTGQAANARLYDSCLKRDRQDKYSPLFVIQQAKRKP